jgi:hypothetical protein
MATATAAMNDGLLSSPSPSIERGLGDRVTALAGLVPRRPIILVLGMHRSGTSLCAHILSALGVDMTDNIPGPGLSSPGPDNPHGHWERWEIVEFHDRILDLFGRDYWGPFHDFPLPVAWWADPRVAQIRREMIAFLERRITEDYFGFKDPRTVRLLPVWHQIFNELKLTPKIVLCLRNPAQVARSLNTRDGLDPAVGEYRWLVHTVDLFRYANSLEMCTVEYEGWFGEPASNLEKLKQFLGLPWHQSETELGMMLSGIIDVAARHDDLELREASQPLVRSLYKLVKRADKDRETHDQIAYIASQFVGFQQLQRPFQQAFEDVAKTAAKYPEIEEEAAALRTALDGVEGRANAAEARLAEATAEIERLRAQVTETERVSDASLEVISRRADELSSALQSAQAELTGYEGRLHDALAEAEDYAAKSAADRAVMEVEIARLRSDLAMAERTGQERHDALEGLKAEVRMLRLMLAKANEAAAEGTAAMQAEIETLHDGLAQAERQAAERATAVEEMHTEVAGLRETLTQAERISEERGAVAENMRGELATLRETLAQAEQMAEERGAVAENMRGELAALRETLAQAERMAEERGAVAENARGQLATLRETLVQAERMAEERGAVAENRRGELATLRETLTQAELAGRERAAAAAALQSEISALRQTLEASRQVGKAAIAALQISGEALPQPVPQPHRWLQVLRRICGVQ